MVNGIPVETVWMGRLSSSSPEPECRDTGDDIMRMRRAELAARPDASRRRAVHRAVQSAPELLPTFKSSTISSALDCWRKYQAVPSVGCPAKGSSSLTVKMRTLWPSALLDGWVARQDERGLRQVGLARQLLHLVIAQAARVGEDGELVALQRAAGKHIELDKRKFTWGHCKAPFTSTQMRCEIEALKIIRRRCYRCWSHSQMSATMV